MLDSYARVTDYTYLVTHALTPPAANRCLAVVGLGYVGLPLAVLASAKGWRVLGLDIDTQKVDAINHHLSPFPDAAVSQQLKSHPIQASTDPAIVAESDVIVIAVPTPVTAEHQPDLQPLINALESILPHLRDQQTLIIESTINPGVMDEVVRPLVQRRPTLTVHLAHCPERINPADPHWTVRNIPRVLGAYTPQAVSRARAFYKSVLDAQIMTMQSPTEAEAVKILENTFRDVNIAFINEMSQSFAALGIDITNVIRGAATKPFAYLPHYPGIGVGGHCISVDPYYMIERGRQAGFNHQFLKLARRINDSMPGYVVTLLEQVLAQQGRSLADTPLALLGLAYKKNVADTRNSPALKTLQLLRRRHATVHAFDPWVPAHSTVDSLHAALRHSSVVLLACDHTALAYALTPAKLAEENIKLVVDAKNALPGASIVQQGSAYVGIGRPLLQPQPAAVPVT